MERDRESDGPEKSVIAAGESDGGRWGGCLEGGGRGREVRWALPRPVSQNGMRRSYLFCTRDP